MEKKEERSEHERVKLELRRLKRSNAPWYFESTLHQRLHGGRPSREHLTPYRIPVAVSLSLGVMALLAIGSYLLLVNTDLFTPRPVGPAAEQRVPMAPGDTAAVRSNEDVPGPALAAPVIETGRSAGPQAVRPGTIVTDTAANRPAASIPAPSLPERPSADAQTPVPAPVAAPRDSHALAPPGAVPRDTTRKEPPVPGSDSTAAPPRTTTP